MSKDDRIQMASFWGEEQAEYVSPGTTHLSVQFKISSFHVNLA